MLLPANAIRVDYFAVNTISSSRWIHMQHSFLRRALPSDRVLLQIGPRVAGHERSVLAVLSSSSAIMTSGKFPLWRQRRF